MAKIQKNLGIHNVFLKYLEYIKKYHPISTLHIAGFSAFETAWLMINHQYYVILGLHRSKSVYIREIRGSFLLPKLKYQQVVARRSQPA